MSIFSYLDYAAWMASVLKTSGGQRGAKKRLADGIGCQPSYLTLVLQARAHLTLEHGERLARVWQLSPEETDYLFFAIGYARAGSPQLKIYYRTRLDQAKAAHENLSRRIKDAEIFPDQQAAIYYSSWQYLAIHILISIPEFQSVSAICTRLQLSEENVIRVLQYLQSLGLADYKQGRWKSTRRQLHLPKESHFISLHHGNWRRRAVDNSFLSRPEDVHYTGVSSLAKRDVETLRQLALKLVDDSRAVVGPSSEEEMMCLSIDLFKV